MESSELKGSMKVAGDRARFKAWNLGGRKSDWIRCNADLEPWGFELVGDDMTLGVDAFASLCDHLRSMGEDVGLKTMTKGQTN